MTLQQKEQRKAIIMVAVAAGIFAAVAAIDHLATRDLKCPKCGQTMKQLSASDPNWTGFPVHKCPNPDCRFIDSSDYKN